MASSTEDRDNTSSMWNDGADKGGIIALKNTGGRSGRRGHRHTHRSRQSTSYGGPRHLQEMEPPSRKNPQQIPRGFVHAVWCDVQSHQQALPIAPGTGSRLQHSTEAGRKGGADPTRGNRTDAGGKQHCRSNCNQKPRQTGGPEAKNSRPPDFVLMRAPGGGVVGQDYHKRT